MKKTLIYLPVGILTIITASCGVMLASASVSADISAGASVTVNSTCSFNATYDYPSELSMNAGTTSNTESDANKPTAALTCNNPTGFTISGIGYSPTSSSSGAGVEGATAMYGANGTIATGTSGDDSYWGFKITTLTASTSASTSYSSYSNVPSGATTVATFTGSSAGIVTGTFRPDYQVHISTTQPAGTYTGAMKYTIVPSTSS